MRCPFFYRRLVKPDRLVTLEHSVSEKVDRNS